MFPKGRNSNVTSWLLRYKTALDDNGRIVSSWKDSLELKSLFVSEADSDQPGRHEDIPGRFADKREFNNFSMNLKVDLKVAERDLENRLEFTTICICYEHVNCNWS